jgi:hypothetical protein
VAVVAVLVLPHPPRAGAQDPCNPLVEDCTSIPSSTTRDVVRSSTSTTEDDGSGDVSDDEETTTTERRRTTTTEIVTTTTFTVTTLHNILIPGDGTAGAESTSTTAPELTTGSSGISDETLILVIVAGLAIVTAIAAILTYRYWSATQPRVVAAPQRSRRPAALD